MVATANIKPVAGECATSDFGAIAPTIHAEHKSSADGIGARGNFQLSSFIQIRSSSAIVARDGVALPVLRITPEMIIARVGILDISSQARQGEC